MIRNYLSICLLSLFTFSAANAARIDTLRVESPAMKRNVEVLAITPERATDTAVYPTLYLLHGHGGNARTWLGIKPELTRMADRDGIIVVCPDGENSWYWDSPMQSNSRFETFISEELTEYIDTHYPTKKDRMARAIAGLSMGGHGSMWISIRHKDLFGAAGSTSGGVDLRPFPNGWNLKEMLGEQSLYPQNWESHTAINLLDKLKDGELAIIIDCGSEDFFLKVNEAFHKELDKRKIGHDFIIRPGMHNTGYWRNSIDYQWLFFKKFFTRNRTTPNAPAL